jgi:hypothetical protein
MGRSAVWRSRTTIPTGSSRNEKGMPDTATSMLRKESADLGQIDIALMLAI